jgi:hypothetical protein
LLKSLHAPQAFYDARTNRTYFVYRSGWPCDAERAGRCGIYIGWFDHNEGRVRRARQIYAQTIKKVDAGPALVPDGQGYVWVFVGSDRRNEAVVLKSAAPHDLTRFEEQARLSFADAQPWYKKGEGFVLLCSINKDGRWLPAVTAAQDGVTWSEPRILADLGPRHRFVSGRHKDKLGLVFNASLNERHPDLYTDLYYVESRDWGRSWHGADGQKIELPIRDADHFSLMRDYRSMKRITSIKDLNFDRMGNPTVLYMSTFAPGIKARRLRKTWYTARWFRQWYMTGLIMSDHIEDSGCLLIDERMNWTLPATTDPGLRPNVPGGDVVMWLSRDQGRSWYRKTLTEGRHCWSLVRPRRSNAELAFLWLGAELDDFNGASVYYSDESGQVRALPRAIPGDDAPPTSQPGILND